MSVYGHHTVYLFSNMEKKLTHTYSVSDISVWITFQNKNYPQDCLAARLAIPGFKNLPVLTVLINHNPLKIRTSVLYLFKSRKFSWHIWNTSFFLNKPSTI